MAKTLIWVTEGPKAGEFLEVDAADADQAEAEGWAQKTEGRDGSQMRQASPRGPHKKAEAYLNREAGGYENRELRANPAPAPKAATKTETMPAKAPATPVVKATAKPGRAKRKK